VLLILAVPKVAAQASQGLRPIGLASAGVRVLVRLIDRGAPSGLPDSRRQGHQLRRLSEDRRPAKWTRRSRERLARLDGQYNRILRQERILRTLIATISVSRLGPDPQAVRRRPTSTRGNIHEAGFRISTGAPLCLPGIRLKTSPTDRRPIKQDADGAPSTASAT